MVTSNVNFDVATIHLIAVERTAEAWIYMIKRHTDKTSNYTTEESQIAHCQNVLFTGVEKQPIKMERNPSSLRRNQSALLP